MSKTLAWTLLAVVIVCIVAFVQLLKLSHHWRRSTAWVGLLNYSSATVLALAWCACDRRTPPDGVSLALGAFIGLSFAGGYFVMAASVRELGTGITQIAERLAAVLLPTAAAMVFWDGRPSAVKLGGLGLTVLSFLLLGMGSARREASSGRPARKAFLLAALVAFSGAIGISLKIYGERVTNTTHPVFFLVMYAASTVAFVAPALRAGVRPGIRDLVIGAALGALGLVCNIAYAAVIASLDGIVVFPSVAVGVIVVGTSAAMVVWRERYALIAYAGIVLAAIALVLVNLPG